MLQHKVGVPFFLVLASSLSSYGQVYTFTQDFEDPDWFDQVTWTKEGASHPEIRVLQFSDADPYLGGASIGSASGGLRASLSDYGIYTGGDHGEVYLDYHMSVPPGTYSFEIALNELIYWAEFKTGLPGTDNPWGCGINFHIGDAATLEYTSQLAHQAPLGPWVSPEFPGHENFRYAMMPTIWIGWNGTTTEDFNGLWLPRTYQQAVDGTTELTTTGQVIFRMVMRDKWTNSENMVFAMDDLVVKLTRQGLPCHEPILFDLDDDEDVDMTDFAGLQTCYTGPEVEITEDHCFCLDINGDNHITEMEVAAFVICASAPHVPADPACDD